MTTLNLQVLKESQWKFSPIPNIEESKFNETLESFLKMGINGLTRENIQNSLDGHLPNSDEPVIVKIKTGSIHKDDIPGIESVKERIKTLEGHNDYTKETIKHMKNKLNDEEVRYISFEDINTKGLTGARNGQSGSKKDTWSIYAYNKGVHFEEDDSEREISRGGSHGVGKIASNAASDLHVMYFANCDANGDQHLGGTVQLIEHVYDNQAYRNTGYFTDIEILSQNDSKFYPYENNFNEVFKKETRGLKIVIPYLRDKYDDERDIIKSICDSFFISILENRLEVHVNDQIITKDTILDYVRNQDYYKQDIEDAKKEFTPLYLETYLNEIYKNITVSNIKEDFHFKLYFRYDERIPKGRVAVVRTVGMKIEDFKVENMATKPFNAVLIGGPKEDAYLKLLENESHTKLSEGNFNDPKLKKQAKKFIKNLSREIAKIVDEAIKQQNPTDGLMETDDILYVVETQFKKDLENSMGTVRVNKGKSLVKSSGNKRKKEKRDKRKDKGTESPKNTQPKRKRNPLKWQIGDDKTDKTREEGKDRYSAHPEMVQRVILNDREMIKFDFSRSNQMRGVEACDIAFSIIDGMGEEYNDEFKIQDSYMEILDINTGKRCAFDNEKIKDVQIKDGAAQLQLKLRETFNRSLKFIYYVEV